jgi:hypothetical protein
VLWFGPPFKRLLGPKRARKFNCGVRVFYEDFSCNKVLTRLWKDHFKNDLRSDQDHRHRHRHRQKIKITFLKK